MQTKIKEKNTGNKKEQKIETKASDGSKHVEKTTAKKKLDGSTEVKHKEKTK